MGAIFLAMGDSKIVRQLRFHSGGNAPGASQGEAPVRGYGSGHQAQRPRTVVNSQTAPGAPDGPVGGVRGAPGAPLPSARAASPHPHNGLTRRPGLIPVTPGIGEDNVKVTRALAPSQRALETQAQAPTPSGPPQSGPHQSGPHYPPIGGASSGVTPFGVSSVRPVVLSNGFTRAQRDLIDALLDKSHDDNTETNAELAQLATETKQAVAQFPVLDPGQAGDVEDISAPAPRSARPSRVAPMGGTNPPGEVRIFAPNRQPFETVAGRHGNNDNDQQPPPAQ